MRRLSLSLFLLSLFILLSFGTGYCKTLSVYTPFPRLWVNIMIFLLVMNLFFIYEEWKHTVVYLIFGGIISLPIFIAFYNLVIQFMYIFSPLEENRVILNSFQDLYNILCLRFRNKFGMTGGLNA